MKTKREQIIEILENKRLKSFGSIIKTDFPSITDAILDLDEQKKHNLSAEEILDKYWSKQGILKNNVLKAMKEYANQSRQTKEVKPTDEDKINILKKFAKYFNTETYCSIEGWIIDEFINEELSSK
jgi:DNA topoisomerase VI subunit B